MRITSQYLLQQDALLYDLRFALAEPDVYRRTIFFIGLRDLSDGVLRLVEFITSLEFTLKDAEIRPREHKGRCVFFRYLGLYSFRLLQYAPC